MQIVSRTDVGLGEAYMAGDYLVDDLGAFMALMVRGHAAGSTGRLRRRFNLACSCALVSKGPSVSLTLIAWRVAPAAADGGGNCHAVHLGSCCRLPTLASWRAARARWVW